MNDDDVLAGVCACVAKVVDADPSEVAADRRIIGDLGADSLDLLDLVFQLEQHFGIRIKTRDIERRVQGELGGAPLTADGKYTAEALALLRKAMPEAPASEMAEGLRPADLPYRFRVSTFASLVKRLIKEQHG